MLQSYDKISSLVVELDTLIGVPLEYELILSRVKKMC